MLELPEVEVLRKDLERELVGKRVKGVTVRTASLVTPFHRTRPDFAKLLEGRKIGAVRRRGTVLFLDLDESLTWLIDPGESGSVHREASASAAASDAHWVVAFVAGGALAGIDTNRAGSGRTGVVDTATSVAAAGVSADAIDPLEDNPTWPDFLEVLKSPPGPMKAVLQDGKRILGIGDVYGDEVLWEAGLRFDRVSDSLSSQEVRRLYRAVQEVVHGAIKFRGNAYDDDGTFDEAGDEEGERLGHLRVYGREGLPCLRCRQRIVKAKWKKKSVSYVCEQCQI